MSAVLSTATMSHGEPISGCQSVCCGCRRGIAVDDGGDVIMNESVSSANTSVVLAVSGRSTPLTDTQVHPLTTHTGTHRHSGAPNNHTHRHPPAHVNHTHRHPSTSVNSHGCDRGTHTHWSITIYLTTQRYLNGHQNCMTYVVDGDTY